jgi:hypothetical protein
MDDALREWVEADPLLADAVEARSKAEFPVPRSTPVGIGHQDARTPPLGEIDGLFCDDH